MGMERMREFTLWRIFDFTNYTSQDISCEVLFLRVGLFNIGSTKQVIYADTVMIG